MCPGWYQEHLHLEHARWCFAATRPLWKIVGSLLKLDAGTEDVNWKGVSDLSSAPLSTWHSLAWLLLFQQHKENHSISRESAPRTSHSLQRTGQKQGRASFFQLLYLACFASQPRWNMFLPDKTNSYSDTERQGALKGSKPSVVRGFKCEGWGLNNTISEYYVTIESWKSCPVSWRVVITSGSFTENILLIELLWVTWNS